MKSSGVKFNIVTEEDAREFLLDSTYYFKLKAFQKNYNKKQNGDYINLEFAYLKDFMKRFSRHFEYYNSNDDIKKAYIFFQKLIDNYEKNVYNNEDAQKT